MIHDGTAPGILSDGEETESDLDVEWSSAVAKGAQVDFVVAESTETTAGITLSALHIIDNNLAPVMSESYGFCELGLGTAGNQGFNAMWEQAAAQGITVMISAGDNGAAGCDNFNAPGPAQFGLQVSGYASTPFNVAVGGTDFYDLTNSSLYWKATNAATTQASAIRYIPETTWDDSCTNPVFGTLLGYSNNAEANCNNFNLIQFGFVNVVGGSGGKSSCTISDGQNTSSCSVGYPKPSWQVAPGVPADGVRDLPGRFFVCGEWIAFRQFLYRVRGRPGARLHLLQSNGPQYAISGSRRHLGFVACVCWHHGAGQSAGSHAARAGQRQTMSSTNWQRRRMPHRAIPQTGRDPLACSMT